MRASGIPLTRVAAKLGVSRQTVYNLFNSQQVSWDVVEKVGLIIGYDFSVEIKGNKKPKIYNDSTEIPPQVLNDSREEVNYWKNKYIELLEEHKALLNTVAKMSKSK